MRAHAQSAVGIVLFILIMFVLPTFICDSSDDESVSTDKVIDINAMFRNGIINKIVFVCYKNSITEKEQIDKIISFACRGDSITVESLFKSAFYGDIHDTEEIRELASSLNIPLPTMANILYDYYLLTNIPSDDIDVGEYEEEPLYDEPGFR